MLGLKIDNDTHNVRSLAAGATAINGGGSSAFDTSLGTNNRSHKFATQLAGRFFVSGISGGFEKATREKLVGISTNHHARKPKVAEAIFKQRQAQEIKEDAARLVEIEQQLREIQRNKELRRQRDRVRKKKKLEYTSACKIQRAVRYFFGTKLKNAVDTIVAFIRVNRATQALAIGAWAAGVLRRFSSTCALRFLERKRRKYAEERAAYEEWSLTQKVMAELANARKEASTMLISNCLKQGFVRAMVTCTKDAIALQRKKSLKKSPKKSKKLPANSGDAHLQFFITEFDSGETSPLSTSSISSSVSSMQTQNRRMSSNHIVEKCHVPALIRVPTGPATGSAPINASQSAPTLPTIPMLNESEMAALLDEAAGDGDDEEFLRRQRIQARHEERQKQMLLERQHRLIKLEQSKREKDAEMATKLSKDAEERERRELTKRQWLARYEAEQIAKARAFAKVVAEKNKQKKAEDKELALMAVEDVLRQIPGENRASRPPVPRIVRPKAPTPSAEEIAKKKEEEAMAAEIKRKQQQELVLKSEAALRQRLAMKKQQDLVARQKEEEIEKLKAEQKAKVATEAQAKLLRAMQLKQLALERNEANLVSDAVEETGKVQRKKSTKSSKGGAKRSKKLLIDPSIVIPVDQMAAIEEWNHNLLPANGGSPPEGLGNLESDFLFDEFILHASETEIESRPLTKAQPTHTPPLTVFRDVDNELDCQNAEHDGSPEEGATPDDLNHHTFADMLDDEGSHYDWLETVRADSLGAEPEYGRTDLALRSELSSPDLYEGQGRTHSAGGQSAAYHDENSIPMFNIKKHANSSMVPSSGPRKFKSSKKTPAIVSKPVFGDSKGGASTKRSAVAIPPSLKDTPYYAAYIKSSLPIPPSEAEHYRQPRADPDGRVTKQK